MPDAVPRPVASPAALRATGGLAAPAVRSLSVLLGLSGAIGAWLLWRGLVAVLPATPSAGAEGVRLGLAALALAPAAAVLWLMTLVQAAARFALGAFDPVAGADGRFLRVNQRVIGNTAEQLCAFAPLLLGAASLASGTQTPAVLALAVLFALARLVFWGGYLLHPLARAPGMAATLAATAGALLALVALGLAPEWAEMALGE